MEELVTVKRVPHGMRIARRRRADRVSIVAALVACALATFAAPAAAAPPAPSVPVTIYSGLQFTITGSQVPRPPYSSAGTLQFQHFEKGKWHGEGAEAAVSDALPFIVRPSVGQRMNVVGAIPLGGPAENKLAVSVSVPNSGIGSV